MHAPPSTAWSVHPLWNTSDDSMSCLVQTPPLSALLEHPSWLQILRSRTLFELPVVALEPSVAWLSQNFPCLATLLHPSRAQVSSLNAPCFRQSPPLLATFVHPSWLQEARVVFAPCLQQTPPCWTCLVQSGTEHNRYRLPLGFATFGEGPSFSAIATAVILRVLDDMVCIEVAVKAAWK